ncbi:MAG TPA: hypothetical protein VJ874_01820, partial [Candidatus Thermoplasmatota archaeon]|nr:hypothetical protein [Candidatus Thermoplasmatota archaeon]
MANQTTTHRTPRRTTRRRIGASTRRRAPRPSSRSSRPRSASRSSTRTAPRSARSRSTGPASRSRARGRRSGGPRASLASDPDRIQVQRLLDRFTDAFTQGDGRSAAECFAYPNLMVMGNGTQLLEDEGTVADFFDGAPAQYQPKGIHDTRADIHKIDRLNDRLLLVHTHWPYIDAQGNEMGDGESSV